MNYLLDVNVLLAWGWADHVDHRRVASWIGSMKKRRGIRLLTSSIPELGFVRVSVQRTGGLLSVADAVSTLEGMLRSLGTRHRFLADDRSSTRALPDWCRAASLTTDAHLLLLARGHEAELATLDTGIPDALLLPMTVP
jgi:toxin-antitoxin system PIN domain toxin